MGATGPVAPTNLSDAPPESAVEFPNGLVEAVPWRLVSAEPVPADHRRRAGRVSS
ncbi:hypothetical protein GCM10010430_31120 [Kitasatospora cystarginea]|uniref:Uncharacterized protein n=1 Tax=Kitasatospora cystarginea TaxID=58350 RepID=A0ABP5R1S8_9ACTN